MAKMQSCEGKREVRRQNGEEQRCEDEGMILISLFRIHTFAFSSSPFFLYFGQLHTILFRYRFRPSFFACSCLFLVRMRQTVWRHCTSYKTSLIFKVIWYIFLLVAKPNHHVLHIKCTAYNSVYVFPDFCHLHQSAYPDSILWVFKHSNIWISLYKARVQGWEWSQLQNMHLIAYMIQITILQSCLF